MRILGIDCGLAITGWAVIDQDKRAVTDQISIVEYGVIRTKSKQEMGKRLKELYSQSIELITQYMPNEAAVESLFYFKNQKTVMMVGQARGVSLLALAQQKVPVFDYTPLQVKQSVTGYGKASKRQVQLMVKKILGLKRIPKPDDAADAIAVALSHAFTQRY